MKDKIMEWILNILFLIVLSILIVQLIFKLTGHSPKELQVLYIGFGCIASYLIGLTFFVEKFMGEVKTFMKVAENSFKRFGMFEEETRVFREEVRQRFNVLEERLG